MLSGSWPGEIFFFRRKPNGTYGEGEHLKDRSGSKIHVGSASVISLADWDGDKDLDIFLGNIKGEIFYSPNEGSARDPKFAKPTKVKAEGKVITMAKGDSGPAVADWDADGKPDLLAGSGSGAVNFYKNLGGPIPNLAAAVELISAPRTESNAEWNRSALRSKIAIADWNGDGLEDLFVGDFVSGSAGERDYHGWVWVYLRKSGGAVSGN